MTPERFRRLRETLARRQPDLTVLMDGVHKSHNFSAILRNCDAAGVLDAHVVPSAKGLDIHHGTSAGTTKWVWVHRHETVIAAAEHLRQAGFRIVAAHPATPAVDYREADYTAPTAIMLGAELRGVSEEGLAVADAYVRIPMEGMVHSLNVSVAASLLLFEARRQREAAGMYGTSRLPADELARRLFEWAYPTIASRRRREGRAYPALDEQGRIVRG